MSYAIRIREKTGEGPWLFEQHFASREAYEGVAEKCINKKVFWESVFIPARTAPCNSLCRNLFIPATYFVTVVLKDAISEQTRTGIISELAFRLLFALGALIVDLVTLPIRLVTLIPRLMMGDAKREDHPLHRYLAEEGADRRILNADQVALRLEWEENGFYRTREYLEESFHFIRLPPSENDGLTQRGNIPLNAQEIFQAEYHRLGRVFNEPPPPFVLNPPPRQERLAPPGMIVEVEDG